MRSLLLVILFVSFTLAGTGKYADGSHSPRF